MSTNIPTHKGSTATVLASFLHFDWCFTLWVLLGSLSIFITKSLGLNPAQQGLMVAVPTLSGSLMRIVMGLLSDRLGGKRTGVGMLVFLFLPLLAGWLLPINFSTIIIIGLMLGVAGSSFAVALPLASRWYPAERQGLVMGITAAGNIGSVMANLCCPALAKAYGWNNVMGLAMIPLAVILLVFLFLAKESPDRPQRMSMTRYLAMMKQGDLWWFCLFYCVTFGGFVGLSTFMPLLLKNQYALNPVTAGMLTALAAFMGSSIRPLGGYLADRFGGTRALTLFLTGIGVIYGLIALLPSLNLMCWLLVIGMTCLGLGNGAVFQLVPFRFRLEVGLATGIVGAFGGVGGFLLPTLLGSIKQVSGTYSSGFVILSICAFVALVVLRLLISFHKGWRFARGVSVVKTTA